MAKVLTSIGTWEEPTTFVRPPGDLTRYEYIGGEGGLTKQEYMNILLPSTGPEIIAYKQGPGAQPASWTQTPPTYTPPSGLQTPLETRWIPNGGGGPTYPTMGTAPYAVVFGLLAMAAAVHMKL